MPMTHAKTPPTRRGFALQEFKALDEQHGTFSGYLAVFNNEDAGGDIIEPGAFRKTLSELQTKQRTRQAQNAPSGRYQLPIFWAHDDAEPIGGFITLREDSVGLYVEGELDMDIQQGQRAYSGLAKGYIPGMSIGYFAIKKDYDRAGRRHLRELSLFEGTVTASPMNEAAIVNEIKSATGKATWPLGARDAAWDGAAAHDRIVAWATDSGGDLDPDKLASVHFYSPTGDARGNISAYKLLYCDLVSGDVKAMPKGIFACAGSHGVEAAEGISQADKDAIKRKISAYYARMAKEFDDESLQAPWETDGGKGKSRRMPTKPRPANAPQGKARDFDTLFQSLNASDQLQDDWGDTFIAFTRCMSELMYQATAQTNGWLPAGSESVDIEEAAQANLDAFSKAVMTLVQRSMAADFCPMLDGDGDQFLDPDGPNADDDDCNVARDYMALDTSGAEQKRGAVMSAANHKALGAMVAQAKSLHAGMKAFHAKMSATTEPDGGDAGTTQSGEDETSSKDGKSLNGAGQHNMAGTTPQGNEDDDEAARMQAMIADMQLFIRARTEAAAAH